MSKKNKKKKNFNKSEELENQGIDKKNEKNLKPVSDDQSKKNKKNISGNAGNKKEGRKTFKPVKPLKQNPIKTILEQHQAHKLRLMKLIGFISVVFIGLFLIFFFYESYNRKQNIKEKINVLVKKLDDSLDEVKKTEGYLKDRNISKAIILTYLLEKKDWKNASKWIKKRKEYFAQLNTVLPEINKNFVQPAIAMNMIAIPKGDFLMGRTLQEVNDCYDERPQRKVKIDYPFWMASTEITNFQYRMFFPQYGIKPFTAEEKFIDNDKVIKSWRNEFPLNYTTQPVTQINWHSANKYCEMLTYTEGNKKRLPEGYVYRLPTEAEWEYACRAGTDTYFYWGDDFGEEGAKYANCLDRNSAKYEGVPIYAESAKRDGHFVTAPVASFLPNKFGLYDMSGNVWEWCWDWYNPKAYKELPDLNPVQKKPIVADLIKRGNFEREIKFRDTSKVLRGGGCFSPPSDCRSATRASIVPGNNNVGIGFRIVLAPPIESLNSEKSK